MHKWLLAHPRFELHFTPTYSSWTNQVERWFAELQRRCLERGVFCSLDELKTALEDWIKTWSEQARPFRWNKTADQITDRICRYRDRISGPGHRQDLADYIVVPQSNRTHAWFLTPDGARLTHDLPALRGCLPHRSPRLPPPFIR